MVTITIISKSKKGDNALNIHMNEYKQMSFREKIVFKTAGFKQELITENPLVIMLTIKNRHSEKQLYIKLLTNEIEEALKLNGATEEDYNIEVLKQ